MQQIILFKLDETTKGINLHYPNKKTMLYVYTCFESALCKYSCQQIKIS